MGFNMRVLVVEDEESLREELALILEFEGYEIETASDGLQGLDSFEAFQPDLIITDMKMPRMTGDEMLRRIRTEKGSTLPVIVTSAFVMEDWIEKIQSLGASAYLTKPFSLDELLNTIQGFAASVTQ